MASFGWKKGVRSENQKSENQASALGLGLGLGLGLPLFLFRAPSFSLICLSFYFVVVRNIRTAGEATCTAGLHAYLHAKAELAILHSRLIQVLEPSFIQAFSHSGSLCGLIQVGRPHAKPPSCRFLHYKIRPSPSGCNGSSQYTARDESREYTRATRCAREPQKETRRLRRLGIPSPYDLTGVWRAGATTKLDRHHPKASRVTLSRFVAAELII